MQRRHFVKSALATAASTAAFAAEPQPAAATPQQEFYQLRKYTLRNGPQLALTQGYFEHVLIPALNRLGIAQVGAFKLDIGPETPTYYLLIPSSSVETLVTLDTHLGADPEYIQAAAGFRDAPASAPAFQRAERSLLAAFNGWPVLTPPKSTSPKRIYQLRTYESPSHAAHLHKVQMFNHAEIGIFTRNGLNPVFFGNTLIGTHMPSLTYMLSFTNLAELTEHWSAFSADPAWKELSHKPGNTDADIVSNISNLYLSSLSCSQI